MTEADVARLAAEVEGVARKAAAGSADAAETLSRVRGELRAAGKKGPAVGRGRRACCGGPACCW